MAEFACVECGRTIRKDNLRGARIPQPCLACDTVTPHERVEGAA